MPTHRHSEEIMQGLTFSCSVEGLFLHTPSISDATQERLSPSFHHIDDDPTNANHNLPHVSTSRYLDDQVMQSMNPWLFRAIIPQCKHAII